MKTILSILFVLIVTACMGGDPTLRIDETQQSAIVESDSSVYPSVPVRVEFPAPAPIPNTPACAALGGTMVVTSTASYAKGLLQCQFFTWDTPRRVCIYSNATDQVSVTNACASITNANSCAYSYPWTTRVDPATVDSCTCSDSNCTACTVTYQVSEVDYYSKTLNGADWLATLQATCASAKGTWL